MVREEGRDKSWIHQWLGKGSGMCRLEFDAALPDRGLFPMYRAPGPDSGDVAEERLEMKVE